MNVTPLPCAPRRAIVNISEPLTRSDGIPAMDVPKSEIPNPKFGFTRARTAAGSKVAALPPNPDWGAPKARSRIRHNERQQSKVALRYDGRCSHGGSWHDILANRMRMRRATRAIVTAALVVTIGWPVSAVAEKIEAALARAYQGNPQLNAQRAAVRQTDEGVPQALSGYRPTISANATAGKQHIDVQGNIPGLLPGALRLPLNIKDSFDTWSVGVNASQNLLNAQTPKRTRAAESRSSRQGRPCG